jgi:hypothetical protein
MVCNATLPDAPAILETPQEREKPKLVKCVKCRSIALDARIACIHCDATFPRPFQLSDADGPFTHDPKIAYYNFVCCDGACEECRRFDGFCFLPLKLSHYRLPISACKYPICWCGIVGVYSDEGSVVTYDPAGKQVTYHQQGGAADIIAFLQRSNGVATKDAIAAYFDAQLAPERERRTREHANVELWLRAYRLEKQSAEQSIPLYRESIQAWKATLRADAASRWDYLESSYNRVTLILEKTRRFSESLHEIEDYRSFCLEMGRKAQLETIAKREARLRKRILQSNLASGSPLRPAGARPNERRGHRHRRTTSTFSTTKAARPSR